LRCVKLFPSAVQKPPAWECWSQFWKSLDSSGEARPIVLGQFSLMKEMKQHDPRTPHGFQLFCHAFAAGVAAGNGASRPAAPVRCGP
jgi:hypothetical protein